MWRIRIHATYKTGMERICHTCVTNEFEIYDEFVRILHTLWKMRNVNIKVQHSLPNESEEIFQIFVNLWSLSNALNVTWLVKRQKIWLTYSSDTSQNDLRYKIVNFLEIVESQYPVLFVPRI